MLDSVRAGPSISPLLFGHNLEFTRRAVWQGLSAEMVANRKFAGAAKADGLPPRWYAIGAPGSAAIDKHVALTGGQSVRVAIAAGGKPAGIGQMGEGIALQQAEKPMIYRLWSSSVSPKVSPSHASRFPSASLEPCGISAFPLLKASLAAWNLRNL
jgi:hypothetical protein